MRTPDDLFDRPEVVEMGAEAVTLHLAALAYSNRLLTDGKVPAAMVARLLGGDNPSLVARLIEGGWWRPERGGFRVVYLLDLQPSKEKVEHERELASARLKAFRGRKRATKPPQRRGNGVSNAEATPSPDPDPDPAPSPDPKPGPERKRAATATRRGKPAADGTAKGPTPTQAKLAAVVDLVRSAGVEIFPTSRDGAALKSCGADAELIAEAYIAAAEGRWNPGGDGFLRGNLSLHLIVARLGGFTASDRRRLWEREAQRYGHYSGTRR